MHGARFNTALYFSVVQIFSRETWIGAPQALSLGVAPVSVARTLKDATEEMDAMVTLISESSASLRALVLLPCLIAGSLLVMILVVAASPFLQILDLMNFKQPARYARLVIVSLNIFWAYPVMLFYFDSAMKSMMVLIITLHCMGVGRMGIGPSKSFTQVEVLVYVFVAGMLSTETKQLHNVIIIALRLSGAYIPKRARVPLLAFLVHGGSARHLMTQVNQATKEYLTTNQMDVGILFMFISSFFQRLCYVNDVGGWYNWIDYARKRWMQGEGWRGSEPAQLYDSSRYFTGLGAILMWLRFQEVADMHVTLGPMLITYRRMLSDVTIWIFIAATTLFAFTAFFVVTMQHDPDGFQFKTSLKFSIMAMFGDWDADKYSFFSGGDPIVWTGFIVLVTLTSVVQINMLIAMM